MLTNITTRARLPLGLDFLHNCIFRFSAIVRFRSPFLLGIFAIAPFFAFLRLVSFRNDGTFRERKSRMGVNSSGAAKPNFPEIERDDSETDWRD